MKMKFAPRRTLTALALAFAGFAAMPLEAATLSVLYKRETPASVLRIDSAAQAALQSFEEKLIDNGHEVIQPDPKLYAALDTAPGVVVTFAADAGLSLVFDAIKQERPYPGSDTMKYAEVRLTARVFNGRRVVASLNETHQITFRQGAEDKAYEAAARRAAAKLSERLSERLQKIESAPPVTDPLVTAASEAPVPSQPASAEPTVPLAAPAKKWGLLFGVSDFANVRKLNPRAEVGNLPAVANDLKAMRAALTEVGVPASQLVELRESGASTARLREALDQLKGKVGPNDQVVVYFSTHGMAKQEGITGFGYPITFDTKLDDKASIIDFEEIRNRLMALPASQVVWVADTCHSGGATLGMPVVEFSRRAISVKKHHGLDAGIAARSASTGAAAKHLAILTASRPEQFSLETAGQGVFTRQLLLALGEARKKPLTVHAAYKTFLEADVPKAVQELCKNGACGEPLAQQPGFAYLGEGNRVAF